MSSARQGALDEAREKLRAALVIFRRLGAQRDAERTEQALAELG
jgi:hypothetical protein